MGWVSGGMLTGLQIGLRLLVNQALMQCLFQRVGAVFRGRMREGSHVFSCGPNFDPHSFVRATLVTQVVKSSARSSFCGWKRKAGWCHTRRSSLRSKVGQLLRRCFFRNGACSSQTTQSVVIIRGLCIYKFIHAVKCICNPHSWTWAQAHKVWVALRACSQLRGAKVAHRFSISARLRLAGVFCMVFSAVFFTCLCSFGGDFAFLKWLLCCVVSVDVRRLPWTLLRKGMWLINFVQAWLKYWIRIQC